MGYLLLATLWLTGHRAIVHLQAYRQSAAAISAALPLRQPFRTLGVAKDRLSCVDPAGTLHPAASEIGPTVTCRNATPPSPLRIDRLKPPVIEANRIRRYRLHGAGFTKDLSITLNAPSFVGSSLSRDSDQYPAEVDPNGQWADVFLSVRPVAGRHSVALRLTNERNQTARSSAPVQATALR